MFAHGTMVMLVTGSVHVLRRVLILVAESLHTLLNALKAPGSSASRSALVCGHLLSGESAMNASVVTAKYSAEFLVATHQSGTPGLV
jgi:hypothetical protein